MDIGQNKANFSSIFKAYKLKYAKCEIFDNPTTVLMKK